MNATDYRVTVWRKAVICAEEEVMRATATVPGGRKGGEDLMTYVERAKAIQGAGIARWMTACAELELAIERAREVRDEVID